MLKSLIVIPTYNEAQNIAELLEAIFKIVPDTDVLVIDDNSPDRTAYIVETYIEQNTFKGQLHLMRRPGKLGLGTAYIQGFTWGLGKDYDVFISMDADFSHDPKYLPILLKEIENNDLVIGSRYVKGGGVVNWGLGRRILSRGGCLYAQILLLTKVRDFTGGFNCYKRENLLRLNLPTIISKGYCFQIEMKFRHALLGCKIKEIPIIFHDRVNGASKMNQNIFKEAILNTLKLSFNRFQLTQLMKKDN